jgi:hypothetical protein
LVKDRQLTACCNTKLAAAHLEDHVISDYSEVYHGHRRWNAIKGKRPEESDVQHFHCCQLAGPGEPAQFVYADKHWEFLGQQNAGCQHREEAEPIEV